MKVGRVSEFHYLEYTDTYKGVQFVVLFNYCGWRTAYVNVTHTFLEKMDYMDCDNYVDVHGGFTFKDCRLPFEPEEATDYTWLGWDYAHYGDGHDYETAMKLFTDNKYATFVHSTLNEHHIFSGHVYTLDEVISECKNVIEQIIKE